MELKLFSGSVSWVFEFKGNLFSSLCGVLDVKKYLSHSRLAEYSDLHLIYGDEKWFTYGFIDCTFKLIFHLQEVQFMFKHGSLVKNDK